jgi:hypothetical protein
MIRGLNPSRGKRFLSSPKHPDQLWGPPSHLVNGCWGSFSAVKWPGGVMLAIYLHLTPRLRMSGVYLYSPYMPSWHVEGQIYLYDTNMKPAVIPHAVYE